MSNTPVTAIGIIPARYDSSRFPGKLLADLEGMTVLERVWRSAEKAGKLAALWVATDHQKIRDAVQGFGGRVVMTSTRPGSGTERVEEACRGIAAEVVVNIQGDEPLIRAEMIDQVVEELAEQPELKVVTLMREIGDPRDLTDSHTVKVVADREGFALYFSRSSIPYGGTAGGGVFKHVGIYGYRKDFLPVFVALPRGELEKRERLEQLRVLENGYKIKVLGTPFDTIGIDTPEDLEEVRKMLQGSNQ